MNLKKFGLVALSMGAIFCASCGSNNLTYEQAKQYVADNYDSKHTATEKDEGFKFKKFHAVWNFDSTVGDNYKTLVKTLLSRQFGVDVTELHGDNTYDNKQGGKTYFACTEVLFEGGGTKEAYEAFHAQFAKEAGNGLSISMKDMEDDGLKFDYIRKWDGDAYQVYDKRTYKNASAAKYGEGAVNGTIEVTYINKD